MKRFGRNHIVTIVFCIIIAAVTTSCINYSNSYIFDDDEWTNGDYNSENMLLNGEIEIDDYDR